MNEQPIENTPTRRDRSALGWFALGILVGAVASIGLVTLTSPSPRAGTAAAPSAAQANVDINAIREAARLGAKDALLANSTGVTAPLSLADIQTAAKQGAAQAIQEASGGAIADSQDQQADQPLDVDVSGITIRPANSQGDDKATITMIEYSDFQCPFCKRFYDQVLSRVVADYVKTGKVKLSYKHFAFLGDESRWSAQAAECAADQNRFWDFHELLFMRQQGENGGAFVKENLIKLAGEIKLDTAAFTTCLNDDKTLDRVQADTDEGSKVGVRGTPSFLINGELLVGAQPYEAFKKAIDAALAK